MALKTAFDLGVQAAFQRYGLKQSACDEVRLQLPKREYHGFDAAWRSTAKGEKRAEGPTADMLAQILREFDEPGADSRAESGTKRIDRSTMWSAPSSLAAGDAANRGSNMGQPTQNGTAF